jgi:hypothetical protein
MTPTLVEYYDEHWYKIEKEGRPAEYYPSVTTKLGVVAKPFLAKWRGDIGNREADMRLFESQERGTRIHAGWETLCQGGIVLYNPLRKPLFTSEDILAAHETYNGMVEIVRYQDEMLQLVKLKSWIDAVKPKIVASELTVYNEKEKYAGTIDTVMDIAEGDFHVDGRTPLHLPSGRYIVDLKTGNSLDDNAFMQTAAYAVAYAKRENFKETDPVVVGTLILWTGSTNKTGIPGLGTEHRTTAQVNQDFQDFLHVSSVWERKHKDDRPRIFEFPTSLTLRRN